MRVVVVVVPKRHSHTALILVCLLVMHLCTISMVRPIQYKFSLMQWLIVLLGHVKAYYPVQMMTEVSTNQLPRNHTGLFFFVYLHMMLTANHRIALLPPHLNSPIIQVAPCVVTNFIPIYDRTGEFEFHLTSR